MAVRKLLGVWLILTLICSLFVDKSIQDCKMMSSCDDGSLQWITLLKEDEKPTLHHFTNTMTWVSGKRFCQNRGQQLCSAAQLCKLNGGGYQLIPNVLPGDNWVPVSDSANEWLEAGSSGRRTCFIHSKHYGKPEWGTSQDAAPHKGYVYCCKAEPVIKYQYIGKSATYATSEQHCSAQNMRLCSTAEVCPNGKPVFDVVHGDSWIAVNDGQNEWVQNGDSNGRTCWVHGVKYGAPGWGIRTDGKLLNHVGYVYCCPIVT